ncbi:hypothetical protein IFM89_027192 [Coptis chinensis]|uniref:Pentatricopeptide repeat-containing protein n=1 Tax=Coptis chinensis TaxID=261450 RepID=A0A835IHR7_9MAGN|nr:hypothetical protein IFM89_027192 [Coptis chinensis]
MLKSRCFPNRSTFVIMIHGFVRKFGKTKDAIQLFDEMVEKGVSPDTMVYTVVISGLWHVNRTDEAKSLLDSMKLNGVCPNIVTYNAWIDGLSKVGKVDESLSLIGLLKEGMVLKENIVPDVVFYTVMIKGYSEAGKVEEALTFLTEMSERGLVPNTYCYNTLIKGFCDAGLMDKARSLKLEISKHESFPDAATYTILICGLCNQGLEGEAQQIFEEMEKKKCFPTVMTFNALIRGLCKSVNEEGGDATADLAASSVKTTPASPKEEAVLADGQSSVSVEHEEVADSSLGPSDKSVLVRGESVDGAELASVDSLTSYLTISQEDRNEEKDSLVSLSQELLSDMSSKKETEDQGQCRKLTVWFRISLMEWAKRVLALYKIGRLESHVPEGTEKVAGEVDEAIEREGVADSSLNFQGEGTHDDADPTELPLEEGERSTEDHFTLAKAQTNYLRVAYLMDLNLRAMKVNEEFEYEKSNGKLASAALCDLQKYTEASEQVSFCREEFGLKEMENSELQAKVHQPLKLMEKNVDLGNIEVAVRGVLEMDMKCKVVESSLYNIFLTGLCQAGMLDQALKIFNKIDDDEWINFLERMRREGMVYENEIGNNKLKDLRRGIVCRPDIARLVRGMMYYHRALVDLWRSLILLRDGHRGEIEDLAPVSSKRQGTEMKPRASSSRCVTLFTAV